MAQTISVLSGNGGVGKSFFSCNLAYGLKSMGKSVLLVEAVFGNRSDDVILGIKPFTRYSVKDICEGGSVRDAVTIDESNKLPDFICASHLFFEGSVREGIKKIISFANDKYDFVVFDTASAVDFASYEVSQLTDKVFVITDTSFLSLRNTSQLVKYINKHNSAFTVINYPRPSDDSEIFAEDVIDEAGARLIGIIPYDEYVTESLLSGDLIYKYNTYSGKAIENICRRVLGESVPDFVKISKNSFFSKNKLVLKQI